MLPPFEIDLGLCSAVLQAQEGNIYFTELAERVEYGNYPCGKGRRGRRITEGLTPAETLNLRGGTLMSTGNFPEVLSQQI